MMDDKSGTRWPNLLPTLANYLHEAAQSVSLDNLQAVLDLLLIVACALQPMRNEKERGADDLLMKRIIPYMAELLPPILTELSQGGAEPGKHGDESTAIKLCAIVKQVLKIWFRLAEYTFPKTFQEKEHLDLWLSYIRQILALPTPQRLLKVIAVVMSESCTDEDLDSTKEDLEADSFWTMKKWALRIIVLLVHRYGVRGGRRHSSNKELSTACHTRLMALYAPSLVTTCLQMVAGVSSGEVSGWFPSRCLCLLCDIMSAVVPSKPLYTATLKSHLPALLHAFILPRLAMTKAELFAWRQDARSYAQRRTDPFQHSESNEDGGIQDAATTLLLSLISKRHTTVLPLLLSHLSSLFSQQPQASPTVFSERQKIDGALHLVGILSETLQGKRKDSNDGAALSTDALAHLIQSQVLPQLQLNLNQINNQVDIKCDGDLAIDDLPFVTLRAVWLVSQLDMATLPPPLQALLLERLLMLLLACAQANSGNEPVQPAALTDTLMLPVALQAALALPAFIQLEAAQSLLVSQMGPLLHALLSLSQRLEADDVASVLSQLVDAHPEAVAPYAVALAEALVVTLMRLLTDPLLASATSTVDGMAAAVDDDMADAQWEATTNKLMAASGLFKTLHTLIMSMAASPQEILGSLETRLLTPIFFVLQHDQTDLFDDTFAILDALTFVRKLFTPAMWQILQLVMTKYLKEPVWREYLEEMAAFFENAISYGLPLMLTEKLTLLNRRDEDCQGKGLLETFHDLLQLTYQSCDTLGDVAPRTACHLVTVFLLYAWQLDRQQQASPSLDSSPPSLDSSTTLAAHTLVISTYLPAFLAVFARHHQMQKSHENNALQGMPKQVQFEWEMDRALGIVPHLSVFLAALLYDASATLQVLPHPILSSLMQLLHTHYKLFKRVQDKKLLALAMLSAPSHLLTPPLRVDILTFALETLPKAILDRKALEDGIDDSESDDDVYEDVGEDDDDEFEDSDAEEGGKNGLTGHMPKNTAASMETEAHSDSATDSGDTDSDDDDSSWYEACLEEDVFSETPLDTIDVFQCVRTALSGLAVSQQPQHPLFLFLHQQDLIPLEKHQALAKALQQE
jgi:hypothetical protein